MSSFRIGTFVYQLFYTLLSYPRAWQFIREHRVWKGLNSYGWLFRLMIVAGAILSFRMFLVFLNWFRSFHPDGGLSMISSVGTLFGSVFNEGYQLFTAGVMKYVILILLEVIVFHFMRRTLAILIGKSAGLAFKDFLDAQIRMIKVVVRSWVMELIASILIKVLFTLVPWLGWLEWLLLVGVQCYYLGFAILDNYLEQFGYTINESAKMAKDYIGVALSLGGILYILLSIPVIGAVAGPILVSVTGAIVMVELSDLHLRPSEPEPAMKPEAASALTDDPPTDAGDLP